MTSHRSSIQLSLVVLIFFPTSLCNVGTSPCFIIWVSHPFSSRFSSHTSKVSFVIQIWIFPVSSQYLFNCSSPTLMSLAIVSISRSIRLRAATFPPIWVWNTWLNFWFLKFIQVKTNTDALETALDFQLHLEVCKHKVIITCHPWRQGRVLCLPCWCWIWNQECNGTTHCNTWW